MLYLTCISNKSWTVFNILFFRRRTFVGVNWASGLFSSRGARLKKHKSRAAPTFVYDTVFDDLGFGLIHKSAVTQALREGKNNPGGEHNILAGMQVCWQPFSSQGLMPFFKIKIPNLISKIIIFFTITIFFFSFYSVSVYGENPTFYWWLIRSIGQFAFFNQLWNTFLKSITVILIFILSCVNASFNYVFTDLVVLYRYWYGCFLY